MEGQNGMQVNLLAHAYPITMDGHIVAAVRVFEDITALKEADRAKDEFLAVLSHELQTPLTSILGWSDLALAQRKTELLWEAMEVVHRNARRQQLLIREMLDVSRLIHRKLFIEPRPTDLGHEADMAVKNLLLEANDRNVSLLLDLPAVPLPVNADHPRLQQCIGNLVHNGLKFTPAEGQVTVSCRREGDWAVLRVTDTGRGLAPEAIPMIFSPFLQVDRDERHGGLGLGLALVRGLVELHGGSVAADSPGVGLGCTFTIRLPLI